jgi:hypothetical protein
MVVPEEEKKSTVEAVPKTLSYEVERKSPRNLGLTLDTTPPQEVKEKNASDDNTVIEKEKSGEADTSKAPETTGASDKPKVPEPTAHPAPIPARVR